MVCAVTKDNERVPIYVNEARNSYRSFRPIHLKFQKESTQTNIEEGARLEAEMNELLQNPYISDDFPHLKVKFIGFLTMIDGKVSNILTEYMQCCQLYMFSIFTASNLSQKYIENNSFTKELFPKLI